MVLHLTIYDIHEDSVSTAIALSKDKCVLDARPPLVDPSERSLQRERRTTPIRFLKHRLKLPCSNHII
uniref:Uncharacterized protein n=1 Tax=Megaselia scalaris TaxID=36166 RepID=T1GSM8_MEGSC